MRKLGLGVGIIMSLQAAAHQPKVKNDVLDVFATNYSGNINSGISNLEKFVDNTVFVGDSRTIGYTKLLKDAKVVAEGGKSSKRVLQQFPRALEMNTNNIVILCGINNIYQPEKVMSDIFDMVKRAKNQNKNFLVCTLMPWGSDNKTYRKNIEFVNMLIRAQWPENVLDLYKIFNDKKNPGNIDNKYVAGDRLHLNTQGNIKLANLIGSKLELISKLKSE